MRACTYTHVYSIYTHPFPIIYVSVGHFILLCASVCAYAWIKLPMYVFIRRNISGSSFLHAFNNDATENCNFNRRLSNLCDWLTKIPSTM